MTATSGIRRAAKLLAASDQGDQFLAGLVWPVAVRERPEDPWSWIVEMAGLHLHSEPRSTTVRDRESEVAARLLLCRCPRRNGRYYRALDVARIQQSIGARTLQRLLAACEKRGD